MICLLCRNSDTVDGFTSVLFERDETHLTIHRIPAQICPRCGEAYVEDLVAMRLLQAASAILETGLSTAEIEYNDPDWHHDASNEN